MLTPFRTLTRRIAAYGRLVMFSHTIFSFSFAAVALLQASGGLPDAQVALWALLAFLGARTGANALNRVIDAKIDARNPRTAGRQLPRGELSRRGALLLATVCFALLLFSAWRLNPLCLALSPLALALMTVYSYTKRFTWACHLFLGTACACAPVGAWLAVTGHFALEPLLLGAANCLWTAGFDIIYGCQDYGFDSAHGLHSIPVRFGVRRALGISTGFHAAALLFLGAYGLRAGGPVFAAGLAVILALMLAQHRIVGPGRLERARFASYSVSQLTSLALLVFGVADAALRLLL